jgi:hypothetical protein
MYHKYIKKERNKTKKTTASIVTFAFMKKAVNICETSIDLYQTTRGNIPADSHLSYSQP